MSVQTHTAMSQHCTGKKIKKKMQNFYKSCVLRLYSKLKYRRNYFGELTNHGIASQKEFICLTTKGIAQKYSPLYLLNCFVCYALNFCTNYKLIWIETVSVRMHIPQV